MAGDVPAVLSRYSTHALAQAFRQTHRNSSGCLKLTRQASGKQLAWYVLFRKKSLTSFALKSRTGMWCSGWAWA
jgi:hypothetical protein